MVIFKILLFFMEACLCLGRVLGFSLFLYFRHPSISDEKKNAALVETTRDRAATVKSSRERAVSAAEEFCLQMHAIKTIAH